MKISLNSALLRISKKPAQFCRAMAFTVITQTTRSQESRSVLLQSRTFISARLTFSDRVANPTNLFLLKGDLRFFGFILFSNHDLNWSIYIPFFNRNIKNYYRKKSITKIFFGSRGIF